MAVGTPKQGVMYRYYDTPDGQDYFKKLYYLMKPTVNFSLAIAGTDCLAFTKPVGLFPTAERFFRVFFRPVATVTIFTTTVYMSTNLRGKDDPYNYIIASFASGYYWRKLLIPSMTITFTLVTALLLYHLKNYRCRYNDPFIYDVYSLREETDYGALSRFNKWTWGQQYPRTWLTPEEAAEKGIQS